jgi:hypothetical protein
MKQLPKMLALIALVAFLAANARAADEDVPHINKRGDDEKAFAAKLAEAIVKTARTSVKTASLEKFEKKEVKPGRTEWHLHAAFEGRATKKDYTADIVVLIDTEDKNKWEVLNIEYKDNSASLINHNRKNVAEMVKKLNGK